jgi:peptide/nickel transport system permease protein
VARWVPYCALAWAVVTVNFALPRVAPGHPLDYLLGEEAARLSPRQRAEALRAFGLDRPLHEQYIAYVVGLATGRWGRSVRFGRPVLEVIVERLPRTLALFIPATLIAVFLGTVLGAWAGYTTRARWDAGVSSAVLLLDAMPGFWIAMVLLSVFAVELGWFPVSGSSFAASPQPWEQVRRAVLPAATLVLATLGRTFLVVRGAMRSVCQEEFLWALEAKGLPPRAVLWRHALPNAWLPAYTQIVLHLGAGAGGAVVVETVFGYPGMGRALYEALLARDYPLLQGILSVVAFATIVANAAADATYPWFDPRLRGGPAA